VGEDAGAVGIAMLKLGGERSEHPRPCGIGRGVHAGERVLGDGDELGVTRQATGDDAELDHGCGHPPERGRIVDATCLLGCAAQHGAVAGVAPAVQ
jgi:hypothetical protein